MEAIVLLEYLSEMYDYYSTLNNSTLKCFIYFKVELSSMLCNTTGVLKVFQQPVQTSTTTLVLGVEQVSGWKFHNSL